LIAKRGLVFQDGIWLNAVVPFWWRKFAKIKSVFAMGSPLATVILKPDVG